MQVAVGHNFYKTFYGDAVVWSLDKISFPEEGYLMKTSHRTYIFVPDKNYVTYEVCVKPTYSDIIINVVKGVPKEYVTYTWNYNELESECCLVSAKKDEEIVLEYRDENWYDKGIIILKNGEGNMIEDIDSETLSKLIDLSKGVF